MIGALRHRVSLLEPVRTPDGGGGASIAYQQVGEVWAEVMTARPKETERTDALISLKSLTIRVRWRADVVPGWRVIHAGRTLRVTGVRDPDGDRRWLLISTEDEN